MADYTFVLVRKHGSPTKYRAEVQAVGHECDLAILIVDNDEFWEGMNPLELGDVPSLQEAVCVVGYPQGKKCYHTNGSRVASMVLFYGSDISSFLLRFASSMQLFYVYMACLHCSLIFLYLLALFFGGETFILTN